MKTYFHWDDKIKKITRGDWILLMPYRLVDNFWISIFYKQMVRGKAYRQTKDKPNRSIYFQSKKFTKTDFLHDGKQIYLQYKMYCMDQQTQQERSRRSGDFFLFAVIFQRVRHLCCEKTTHTFFFLKNIWQGWKL